ncbi:hypothetical protein Goari_009946 [Gossypium aridum]|uniref:DUF4283 domain-containing protein n=1 Tax=Gossypium aridum TaxID=34290 RepID=A0A7J8XYJ4_GOSAI|nr:hypothetical protein [Gossypium aridum]
MGQMGSGIATCGGMQVVNIVTDLVKVESALLVPQRNSACCGWVGVGWQPFLTNGEGRYLFIGGGTCLVDGEKLIGSSVRKSKAFVYGQNQFLISFEHKDDLEMIMKGRPWLCMVHRINECHESPTGVKVMADNDLHYSLVLRVKLNVMGKKSFQFGSSANKSIMQRSYISYEDVVHRWKIRAIQVGCPAGEDLEAIDTVDISLDEESPNEDTGDSHTSEHKPMENKTEWTKKEEFRPKGLSEDGLKKMKYDLNILGNSMPIDVEMTILEQVSALS